MIATPLAEFAELCDAMATRCKFVSKCVTALRPRHIFTAVACSDYLQLEMVEALSLRSHSTQSRPRALADICTARQTRQSTGRVEAESSSTARATAPTSARAEVLSSEPEWMLLQGRSPEAMQAISAMMHRPSPTTRDGKARVKGGKSSVDGNVCMTCLRSTLPEELPT